MNGAEAYSLLSTLAAFGALATVGMLLLLVVGVLLVLLVLLLIIRITRSIRRRRQQAADESELLEEIAQEIAYCYGHGPLRVMDPAYQHEFRRDARAALAVMRGR
jgi:Flp pilus assembly protein TadB